MNYVHKILDKYYSLTAPLKATLWFMICGFLQKGISFLTTPIFTRVMTDTEYGSFVVYNSWLGIFQILLSLNLAAGVYTRGLVKCEDDQDTFSSSMMGLSIVWMFVTGCIYLMFHNKINRYIGLSTVMMIGMFLEIWGTTTYQFWSNREKVNFQYKKLVVLTIVYVSLRPIVGLIFVVIANVEYQMEARVIAIVLVQILLFTPIFIIIIKKGKKIYHKDYWLYGLKFNIPLIPHYLSQIVLNQSDRVMIDKMIGSAEAAYYSVAYTLAMVLQIMSHAISSTMNPWLYKTLKNGNTDDIGKVSYIVLAIIAGINLFVVAIAPEIMMILAPGNYQVAIWVIPPVTASIYFMFLYDLFAAFQYYYAKTFYVMFASVVGAVLNILFNMLLIPKFGFIAAGYTTLVCYIIYAFVHYYFMKKVCNNYIKGKEIYNVKIIVMIGICFIVCVAIVVLFYEHILIRYLLICGMLLLIWRKKSLFSEVLHVVGELKK